jgi:2-polyprenyl-6-methoxyphenol hydroxylase-like FAD-dependent oxidoreductase
MSPVGGVGINLAVQDAVATANALAEPLKARTVTDAQLAAIQQRRTLPMRVIQFMQVQIQDRVLSPALASKERPKVPSPLKLLRRFPLLRRLPARLVGMGIRPEHIHTAEAERPAPPAEAAPQKARA